MTHRLAAAAAITVVGALALAGCTSDDTDTDAATDVDATAEATEDAMESEDAMASDGTQTIVEVAAETPSLSTLVSLIEAADLEETLSAEGPYTVFAPTNQAFEALDEDLVNALLDEANKEILVQVLTYHVVPGEITSDQITEGDVESVEGSALVITTPDERVQVNQATVEIPDVMASNGVVHVINAVLLPADVDPEEIVTE